jgi:isoleucyl-tRNA synthetase
MIRLTAPILPFTAEEAWGHFAGEAAGSIHLQTFASCDAVSVDETPWERLFTLREQVNTALDQAKKDGVVGSSIAAAITIPEAADQAWVEVLGGPLTQLLIVAAVAKGEVLSITPVDGIKCPRCWNVGTPAHAEHEVHSELCSRCFSAVCDD